MKIQIIFLIQHYYFLQHEISEFYFIKVSNFLLEIESMLSRRLEW